MGRRRIIFCGGRTYDNKALIDAEIIREMDDGPIIVHGCAPGADSLACESATFFGLSVELHPANWNFHGNAAGPIRNKEMIDAGADLVIAFGGGKGTNDCIRKAKQAGIPVREIDR